MNPRRLYRSRDRQLAGVAGGMAEYMDIDPTIIRIAWILITIFSGGLALIAYLLLALIIPSSPYPMGAAPAAGASWSGQPGAPWANQPGPAAPGQPAVGTAWSSTPAYGGWAVPPTSAPWPPQGPVSHVEPARQTRGLGAAGIVGIVLVVIGAIALLDVALPGVHVGPVLGPAVILALGVGLLLSSIRRPIASPATPAVAEPTTGSWASVPADMAPWPSTSAAPAAPAGFNNPIQSIDPDATSTDVPTVSAPADAHSADAV